MAIAGLPCLLGGGAWTVLGLGLIVSAGLLANKQPPSYCILLSIASGEVKALHSDDREFIGKVVQALNDCIVARG